MKPAQIFYFFNQVLIMSKKGSEGTGNTVDAARFPNRVRHARLRNTRV